MSKNNEEKKVTNPKENDNGHDAMSEVLQRLKFLEESSQEQNAVIERLTKENKVLRSINDQGAIQKAEVNDDDEAKKKIRLALWEGEVITEIYPMQGNSVKAMITRGGIPLEDQKMHFKTADGKNHLIPLEIYTKEFGETPLLPVLEEVENKTTNTTTFTVEFEGKKIEIDGRYVNP